MGAEKVKMIGVCDRGSKERKRSRGNVGGKSVKVNTRHRKVWRITEERGKGKGIAYHIKIN